MEAVAFPGDFVDDASDDATSGAPTEPVSASGDARPSRRRIRWGRVTAQISIWLVVAGIGGGLGTWLGIDTGRGISLNGDHHASGPPYAIKLSGHGLEDEMGRELAQVNAERSARHDKLLTKDVLLEVSTFERSAGGVVTRGTIHDLGAPRTLRVVIDAFDADRTYVASGASVVVTGPGSTPFSAEMTDSEDYSSFGVRFLDGDREVRKLSKGDPVPGEPPLLMDDMIYPADFGELCQRLASLGYVQDPQQIQGDAPLLAVLMRFRRDHGLQGPVLITVGDLLALRAVSNSVSTSGVDLQSY